MNLVRKGASHVGPQVISIGNVPTVEDAVPPFVSGVFFAPRQMSGFLEEPVA
jgi:hypothetical protein